MRFVLLPALLICSSAHAGEGHNIPAWYALPFVLLLASMAFVPLIHEAFWERFFGVISLGMGLLVALIFSQLGVYGREKLGQSAIDYFRFIALLGSVFVVSGGIQIDIPGGGNPRTNTLLLAAGLVLANIAGTTGASMLLIRPYLKINNDRVRPFHVVFFIFIVSNCAGALTPIGDPPLFLGYINGVPFEWTIVNCLKPWLLMNALLLTVFFMLDSKIPTGTPRGSPGRMTISGWGNAAALAVILASVFLDKILNTLSPGTWEAWPIGALVMVCTAVIAHRQADERILKANDFHFGPIKEVALLFAGIFVTMIPALEYLSAHAERIGIRTPGGFYFASGTLSSVLDNAPAYMSFLSAAMGLHGLPLNPANVRTFALTHPDYLKAVSVGSVFFGACTYIGNGPNFMVKAIAESYGAKPPSFFAYIFKYTVPILLPILFLIRLLFF